MCFILVFRMNFVKFLRCRSSMLSGIAQRLKLLTHHRCSMPNLFLTESCIIDDDIHLTGENHKRCEGRHCFGIHDDSYAKNNCPLIRTTLGSSLLVSVSSKLVIAAGLFHARQTAALATNDPRKFSMQYS